MRQVQTKLFVGTEASQEDILQVYQRSPACTLEYQFIILVSSLVGDLMRLAML